MKFLLLIVFVVFQCGLNAQPVKQAVPIVVDVTSLGSLKLVNEGVKLLSVGKTIEAEALLGQALVENTDSPEAAYNFGLALAFNGKFQEAAKAQIKAIELKEQFAEAHLALGINYLTVADFDQALQAFKTAEHLAPGPFIRNAALYNKAIVFGKQDRYFEAEIALSDCLASNPGDAAIVYQLAVLQFRQKKHEMALGWLDSLGRDAGLEAFLMKAKIYAQLNNLEKVKEYSAKCREAMATDVQLTEEHKAEIEKILAGLVIPKY